VDAERRLRRLVAESKSESFVIEFNSQVATLLVGPGGTRLADLEKETGRKLAFKGRQRAAHDHFVVLSEGKVRAETDAGPVERGQELEVELEETHLHEEADAIARLDGYVITVAGGAEKVGEKVAIRIEEVGKTSARAVLASENGEKPKKKTRRGSRGGRGRKKKSTTEVSPEPEAPLTEAVEEEQVEASGEAKKKKKTRRGTRGGRGRKRKPVESAPEAGQESPLS
jgi:ribonuclease G